MLDRFGDDLVELFEAFFNRAVYVLFSECLRCCAKNGDFLSASLELLIISNESQPLTKLSDSFEAHRILESFQVWSQG
jgi:hypothetical protein